MTTQTLPKQTLPKRLKPTKSSAESRSGSSKRSMSPRRLLLGRPIRHVALAASFLVIGGLVGVLPFATRAIQNDNFQLSSDRLAKLEAENAALEAQRDLLKSDEEVARIAREEFGLAPQDATIYAIPELRPENGDRDRSATSGGATVTTSPAPKQGIGSKIVDFVVFWD
jgi:cell division protein FtsB